MLSILPSPTLELKSPMMILVSCDLVALGPHPSVHRIVLYLLLDTLMLVHILVLFQCPKVFH